MIYQLNLIIIFRERNLSSQCQTREGQTHQTLLDSYMWFGHMEIIDNFDNGRWR
jgi:hypothetical protein